jgi:hypothetical protein
LSSFALEIPAVPLRFKIDIGVRLVTAYTGDLDRTLFVRSHWSWLFRDPRFSKVRALVPGNGLEKKFSLGEWHSDIEP